MLFFLWQATADISADLTLLELRPSDLDPQGRPYRGEWARGDRSVARARLVQRFFWGGALLLIFVALPRLKLMVAGGPAALADSLR